MNANFVNVLSLLLCISFSYDMYEVYEAISTRNIGEYGDGCSSLIIQQYKSIDVVAEYYIR